MCGSFGSVICRWWPREGALLATLSAVELFDVNSDSVPRVFRIVPGAFGVFDIFFSKLCSPVELVLPMLELTLIFV